MRKAAVAEWVLSLFVSRERASAVVGDLVESRKGLWLAVTRVAVYSVLCDLWDRPGALIFLALQAFVLELGYAVMVARFQFEHRTSQPYFLYGYTILVWYGLGKWLADRAPGREMASAAAFILMNWAFAALIAFLVSHRITGHITWSFEPYCFIFAVAVARRRRLRHA